MTKTANAFLQEMANAKADDASRGVTVSLDAKTAALVTRWRAGKASVKETVARLIEVADSTLIELQGQQEPTTPTPRTSSKLTNATK